MRQIARSRFDVLAIVFVSAMLAGFVWWAVGAAPAFEVAYLRRAYWALRTALIDGVLTNPYVYLGVGAVLVLELLVPARRGQSLLSFGLQMDAAYTVLMIAFRIVLLPIYLAFLEQVYRNYLGFLTIDLAAPWPWHVRLVLGYLAVDFLAWVHHLVRHKVHVFWTFHVVHHSQREMNVFTNERVHPVDYLIARTVRFIPLLMLQTSFDLILAYLFFHELHDRLNHSNVKTNLGPLRHVFVTPQSHRVHHSIRPEHFGRNFGVSLSLWDQLFGTQYRRYDEYPETGVPYTDFPFEKSGRRFGVIFYLAAQFAYPFQQIWRSRREVLHNA
jgi:sterol desaturase/sphingolipid hydroxylase (fatty acid hydroxylase superfamily)